MVETGIPVSKRGIILAQSVKNEAKTLMANEETGLVSLTNKPPMEAVNLGELRQNWDTNLSDPNFVDIIDD